jgi:hypothetical protein
MAEVAAPRPARDGALGIFMMLQPFALLLYTYSFATTLAGVVLFTIVSKFPQ